MKTLGQLELRTNDSEEREHEHDGGWARGKARKSVAGVPRKITSVRGESEIQLVAAQSAIGHSAP